MPDGTLGALLVSSLVSTLVDKDTIRKAIDLLLYSASTFLQMRRKKLLGNNQVSETLESPQPGEQDEKVIDVMSRIDPALDEAQLEYLERELESLLVQLRNHHRMLGIKQEQITQFAEFAPPLYEAWYRE